MKCHSWVIGVFHSSFRPKRAVFQDLPRAAEGQDPLERLEQKIARKESVTKDQVSAAYDDAVENLKKGFTGDADKFETEKKPALDALEQKRDRMIGEADKLQEELETRKTEVRAKTKQENQENIEGLAVPLKGRHRRKRTSVGPEASKGRKPEKLKPKKQEAAEVSEDEKEVQGRKERFNKAVAAGWNATDPDRGDAIIDDYYDWVGARDKHNDTRRTLAGYIAGLQMQNPNLAGGAMKTAKQEFDTTADMWGDKSLTFDSVRNKVIGGNYLSQVEAVAPDLTAQAKGLLAALLRLSDDYLKTDGEKKAYLRYLAETIRHTNFTTVDVKNDFFEKEELPASINIFARSRSDVRSINAEEDQANKEMNALNILQTPADWRDYRVGLLNAFKEPIAKFKESTKTGTDEGPAEEFVFQDEALNNLYEMNADDGVEGIDPKILDAAADDARGEMIKFLDDQKKEVDKDLKEYYPAKIKEVKNKSAGHRYFTFTDDEWKGIDEDLKNVATVSGDLKTDSSMSMDEIQGQADKLAILTTSIDSIDERLDKIDKDIADSTEKEKAIDGYMTQKNLAQTVEGGTYKYAPKDRLSDYGYNTTFEGVKCTFNYLNEDVKSGFGAKVNAYLKPMLDKALTPAQAGEFERRVKAAGGKQEDVDKAYAYANKCFYDNCKKDEIEKIAFVQGLGRDALNASTLEFDHQPTAEELQQQYDDKFVGAWKKAGDDLDSHANASPATASGAGAAGGSLPAAPSGEPAMREAPAQNRDDYKKDWEKGHEANLPANFVGNRGGFEVVDVDKLNLRDLSTHAGVFTLDRGTGAGNTDIILFQPDKTTGWEVDGHVFVEVNFGGRTYWAASDRLKPNEEPAPKTEPGEIPDEAVEAIFRAGVGKAVQDYLEGVKNHGVGGKAMSGGSEKNRWEYLPIQREDVEKGLRKQVDALDLSKLKKRIEVRYDNVVVQIDPENKNNPVAVWGVKEWFEARVNAREKAEKAMKDVVSDVLNHFKGIKTSPAAVQQMLNDRLLDAYRTKGAFGPENYYAEQTVDGVNFRLTSRAMEDDAAHGVKKGDPMFTFTGLVQWVEKYGK